MNNTLLLDCTLRDGGYVNNWNFGKDAIENIIHKMSISGVDVVEIGFIRNEENNNNRAVWNNISDIKEYIPKKRNGVRYAVMAEVFNPLPLDKICEYSDDSIDIVRVIVWKRLLNEGFEYCKGIAKRGYKVCIQPDRVNQYSQEEFIEMIKMFNVIDPMGLYVVDSNGLLDKNELSEYFKLADKYLEKNIILGYHGHNNKLQALGAAEALVEMGLERDIIIDASVSGIGRSSGNLNIEIFAEFMNKHYNKKYDIAAMLEIYSKYIYKLCEESSWGFSMNTYVTAMHSCNPNYASYFGDILGLSSYEINEVMPMLSEVDKVIFNKEAAIEYARQFHSKY